MTRPVAGVILAAGTSTRFRYGGGAKRPKQLFRLAGESLVRRTCREALEAALDGVVLVTGFAAREVKREVADLNVRTVRNPDFAKGQSGSVRRGLAAVPCRAQGAMFLPVDQPGLDAAVIDRLLGGFGCTASIVTPTFRGRRGAPVTFGRRWFGRLEELTGDRGARPLLQELSAHVHEVELDSEAPLIDVDTEAEARRWLARYGDAA